MRPYSFFLYMMDFSDGAPTVQVVQLFPVNVPLFWHFTTQSLCIAIALAVIFIVILFLLLLFHHFYGKKQLQKIRILRSEYQLLGMDHGIFPEYSEIPVSETPCDVIILSGQSNMSGRGGIKTKHHKDGSIYKEWDHIVPPECHTENGTILRLNANSKWVIAQEPLHHDIDRGKVCGVGPGLVFAATVLREVYAAGKTCSTIGLVPCAVGGTQIKEWEKGSRLYERMIARTNEAISKSGSLKALLWYQGESDTLSALSVEEFPQRLADLITNVRSDLQMHDLPVIQVGITAKNHPFPEFLEQVRRAQMELNLPYVYYVDAEGLPMLEDNIHLNMDAQVQLGKMLAEVYVQKVANPAEDIMVD